MDNITECTFIIIKNNLNTENNIASYSWENIPYNNLKSIFFKMFSTNNYIDFSIPDMALLISENGKISLDKILTLKGSNIYADFSDKAKNSFLKIFCSGCREKTKNRVYSALNFISMLKNYGCFSRVMYNPKTETFSYTACQSYNEEVKTVRDCILN